MKLLKRECNQLKMVNLQTEEEEKKKSKKQIILRGNCTPDQNRACFVHYLKMINIFLEKEC